jgi:DNA polymerase-1
MTALGLKSKLILNVHDEVLFEVPEEELDVMSKLAANIYVEAAKELGLTLDWTSHAMIGDSYASCH